MQPGHNRHAAVGSVDQQAHHRGGCSLNSTADRLIGLDRRRGIEPATLGLRVRTEWCAVWRVAETGCNLADWLCNKLRLKAGGRDKSVLSLVLALVEFPDNESICPDSRSLARHREPCSGEPALVTVPA